MTALDERPAAGVYDALASTYDRFTAHFDHERWWRALEAELRDHGLTGRRILDVACGTGKSFEPMLAAGYDVKACDISPAMAEQARRRHPDGDDAVFVADMRELPACGTFDLVTCVDDAVNYLLTDDDLERAFAAAARRLRPGGLYAFDVNTRRAYRDVFATDSVLERDDTLFCWRGGRSEPAAERLHHATLDVFTAAGDGWRRTSARHVQRHHPPQVLRRALAAAGLECVAILGAAPGAQLVADFDEDRHTKLVCIARRPRNADDRKEEIHEHRQPPVTPTPLVGGRLAAGDRRDVELGCAQLAPYGVRHVDVPFHGHLVF